MRIRFVLPVLGAIALLPLSGCATPYRSVSFNDTGGYSTMHLRDAVYRVIFQGNQWTSIHRATDFAYLRAAQVTLEHHYRYFEVIAERKRTHEVILPGSPSLSPGFDFDASPFDYERDEAYEENTDEDPDQGVWWNPGYVVAKPQINLVIKCLDSLNAAGKHAGKIYRARQIERLIERRYHLHHLPDNGLPTVSTAASGQSTGTEARVSETTHQSKKR